MYSSGLTYNRYRPSYEDNFSSPSSSSSNWRSNLRSTNEDPLSMATNNSNQQRRPTRYSRSSTTTSVAQLLTDSCTSLLQKITTRVRGPSATVERQLLSHQVPTAHNSPLQTSKSTTVVPNLGSTRTRLEDKYAAVLDKIYGRRRGDPEKTIEPSIGRQLTKSATTTNVILSEKAYPYVNNNNNINNNVMVVREKTPYRNNDIKLNKTSKINNNEPPYSYLDRDSVYRIRHRSNHSTELRPRRSSKPQLQLQRSGKSELNERKLSQTNLKLCPVEIPLNDNVIPTTSTTKITKPINVPISSSSSNNVVVDDDSTPTPQQQQQQQQDPIKEREAKRKEIQSLIMKYSALDEAYNRAALGFHHICDTSNSHNFNKNNNNYGLAKSVSKIVLQPHQHHQQLQQQQLSRQQSLSGHKYYRNLVGAVSKFITRKDLF